MLCSELLELVQDAEASRISHRSGTQLLRDLAWTEIITGLWYFSAHLVSTERRQKSYTGSPDTGSPATEASQGIDPASTLTYIFVQFHLVQRATEAQTELSAGQARRVKWGQRSCRWAHASAGSPPRGQCGEGGAWHQSSPIMPFHSQDTRLCKALFQHCNLD